MTLSVSNPRAKKRWSFLSIIVGLGLLLGMMLPMSALAAPPKISLEQCRNGSATSPNDCVLLGGSSGWQNGNAGASNAHFVEGHSIPYRALLSDAPAGTNTVLLGYDVKHSDVHAIDFLTHYQRLDPHGAFGHSAETVSPTSGVSGLSLDVASCDIPKPTNLSTAAANTFDHVKTIEGKDQFTVFGADSCSVSQAISDGGTEGDLSQKQSEARVLVTFNATSRTVVMAWGGHIARSADWAGQGAAQIAGSPYHMRLKAWSAGNVGNQDRSLAAAAVIAEQSTTSTTIHLDGDEPHAVVPINTTIPFGSSVHDLATVTGFAPTGNVTFTFYRGGDCTTGTAEAAGTVALAPVDATSSVAHPSTSKGPLTPGNYAFKAVYAGDGTNIGSTSDCEPFSVAKAAPSIATQVKDDSDDSNVNDGASVAIGTTVYDTATLSGASGDAAGTVQYFYKKQTNGLSCTDGTSLGTKSVTNGLVTDSDTVTLNEAGTYEFWAVYSGDGNNEGATSTCGTETVIVDKNSPLAATAQDLIPNDSLTLTGATSTAGGTVDFYLFAPGVTCSEANAANAAYSELDVALASNTTAATTNTTFHATTEGTWTWLAIYSGDANNNVATSNCVETFTIDNDTSS